MLKDLMTDIKAKKKDKMSQLDQDELDIMYQKTHDIAKGLSDQQEALKLSSEIDSLLQQLNESKKKASDDTVLNQYEDLIGLLN